MESIIAVNVQALLVENGFSLDELVIRTKELFEQHGIPGFLGLLLDLLDTQLCTALIHNTAGWKRTACCANPAYELQGRPARRFRTGVGTVHIHWRRLRCRHCHRSCIPLREFLGLERYQSKTGELERIVTEVVSEQNYRRATRHLALIGMIPIPKTTAHRWVTTSNCDEFAVEEEKPPVLMADGTAYKRRPVVATGVDNRGEVRIALGIRKDGKVKGLGVWSGESWEAIGKALGPKDPEVKPQSKLLVSDGEPGLAEGLAHLVDEQQRCHWHLVRDLGYALTRNQASKSDREELKGTLTGILGIELPAADFQKVSESDKAGIEQTVVTAEAKLDELIQQLIGKGYNQAANYIRYARDKLFNYVRVWLSCGLVSMRVTSQLERLMREIGRRLKRIAFGWGEEGAAQMTRIIIKRITSADEWTSYWNKRFNFNGGVRLIYKEAQAR